MRNNKMLLGAMFSLLLFVNLVVAQTPQPIASTKSGSYTLDLYTVSPKPFGLDDRDTLFRFADDDVLRQMTGNNTFGPWETTRGSSFDKDEYVLGFLLRNGDGQLPAGMVRTASAYRATTATGGEDAYWPRRTDYPINEISQYSWDFNLAPLVVSVPKGTREITKLEGAIVMVPQRQTAISLTAQDIKNKAVAYRDQVVVAPIERNRVQGGTTYDFLIVRGKRVVKTSSGRNRVESGAIAGNERLNGIVGGSVNIGLLGKFDGGEALEPNTRSSVSISAAAKRSIVREVVSKLRKDQSDSVIEEAVKKVITDKNAEFTMLRAGFKGDVNFDEVEVRISVTTGMPAIRPFEMTGIPVPDASDPDSINNFVASLESEQNESLASPLDYRTWKDKSGAYSVKAKFLGIKENAVGLEKEDGSVVRVPIDKLSDADLEYISSAK